MRHATDRDSVPQPDDATPKQRHRQVRSRHARFLICAGIATLLVGVGLTAAFARAPRFLRFPDAAVAFIGWGDLQGWSTDNQKAAFDTFVTSCSAVVKNRSPRPLRAALGEVCRKALAVTVTDNTQARRFFEQQFRPVAVSPLDDDTGLLTGYYEPVIEGSRVRTDIYTTPIYGRPADLVVLGPDQGDAVAGAPNKGPVGRNVDGKIVPYYSRAEIADGALEGRGLALCWLKDPVDLFFAQIQGSVRVDLTDGGTLRLNYSAHNGLPYTAVGRYLIDRKIIPRAEMSLARIRAWMEDNPETGEALRRLNRSYVFFRKTDLTGDSGPIGAQGVSLTAGRSIAVDSKLHVYGTPFFIIAQLPLTAVNSSDDFNRLMIAQDTGSAIIGPARADIYFGAGAELGHIAGRIRHHGRFTMLVPRSLDPAALAADVKLPRARPALPSAAASKPESKPSAQGETADAAKGSPAQAEPLPLPDKRAPAPAQSAPTKPQAAPKTKPPAKD